MDVEQIEKDFTRLAKINGFVSHISKFKIEGWNVLGLYIHKIEPKGAVLHNLYYKSDADISMLRPINEIFEDMKNYETSRLT